MIREKNLYASSQQVHISMLTKPIRKTASPKSPQYTTLCILEHHRRCFYLSHVFPSRTQYLPRRFYHESFLLQYGIVQEETSDEILQPNVHIGIMPNFNGQHSLLLQTAFVLSDIIM